jgi:nitrite reductase/ring-hydroxylating ferredoxin subunit
MIGTVNDIHQVNADEINHSTNYNSNSSSSTKMISFARKAKLLEQVPEMTMTTRKTTTITMETRTGRLASSPTAKAGKQREGGRPLRTTTKIMCKGKRRWLFLGTALTTTFLSSFLLWEISVTAFMEEGRGMVGRYPPSPLQQQQQHEQRRSICNNGYGTSGRRHDSNTFISITMASWPSPSQRTAKTALAASEKKKDGSSASDNSKSSLENDGSSDSDSTAFSITSFFKQDRGNREDSSLDSSQRNSQMTQKDGTDGEEKSWSLPIVGRLFSKNDDDDNNTTDKDEDEDSSSSSSRVRSAFSRYMQTRRLRKDAEALREEVLRQEEERQRQLEAQRKIVEEAKKRMGVATGVVRENRQAEVKRQVDILRQIEAQKVVDSRWLEKAQKRQQEQQQQRRQQELLLQPKATAKPGEKTPKKSSSSSGSSSARRRTALVSDGPPIKSKQKERSVESDSDSKKTNDSSPLSRRLDVMSAAQKFVSGFFDSEEEWIVVAPKTRISPGEIVPLTVAGIDLLLVASKDGSALHCIANSCPHLGTPLETGTLERLPIESPQYMVSDTSALDGNATTIKSKDVIAGQGGGGVVGVSPTAGVSFFQENDISRMLKEDGCEDCIVCPLHRTAFALESGEVRGEWCPYPPVIGKLTGAIKQRSSLAVFDVRTKGKNIEVRLNTPVVIEPEEGKNGRTKAS